MSKPQTEIFDITDFGAVSDRTAVNTRAIQRAIDNCSDGGIVYVPDGRFITGALYLKSNITLRIDGELFGNGDTIDYPIMKYRFEGFETECYSSLINTADSIETLKITGNGAELRKREMEENAGKPGRAVCIRSGKNISISDITIRQSPAWCLHFIYCDGVSVDNVKIHTKFDENGDRYSGIINGDGIDIDSSKNISIINSLIASQDDCIAVKSGKDEEGRQIGIPSENINISNCVFKCGFGVAVGSEMSGGVKNVFVKDCCFENTYSIASIKAPRGRGGIIENIYYENNSLVKYKDELHDCEWFRGAVYIDQFYSCVEFRADLPKEVNAATPKIRNISIKNTSLETQSGNAVYIVGLPEMPIENITLENMTAVGKYGLKVKNVNGFKSKNICVKSCEDNDYEFKNTIFRWALYHKLRKKYNSP